MKTAIDVYVTKYGNVYEIPPDILAKAKEVNGTKRIADRRTKGEKLLREWADKRDQEWLAK